MAVLVVVTVMCVCGGVHVVLVLVLRGYSVSCTVNGVGGSVSCSVQYGCYGEDHNDDFWQLSSGHNSCRRQW